MEYTHTHMNRMNAAEVEEGNVRIPPAVLQEFKARRVNSLIEAESTTSRSLNQETSLSTPRCLHTETVSTADFEMLLRLALNIEGQEHSVPWNSQPPSVQHHTEVTERRIMGIETTVKWEHNTKPYEVEPVVQYMNSLHVPAEPEFDRISETATPDIDVYESYTPNDWTEFGRIRIAAKGMIDDILESPNDEVLGKAFGFFSGSLGDFLLDREFNALAMLALAVVYFSRADLIMAEHYFIGAVKILEGNITRNEGWSQLRHAVMWINRISPVYEQFGGKLSNSLIWMNAFTSRIGAENVYEEVCRPQTRNMAMTLIARPDLITPFGLKYEGAYEGDSSQIVGSDDDFLAALERAFINDDYKLVDALLLDSNVLFRRTTNHRRSAIYSAIQSNNVTYTAALISCGISLDQSITKGSLALGTAVENRAKGVLELLLRCGLDPNDWDEEKGERSHLSRAVELNDEEMVRILLAHGADPNNKRQTIDGPTGSSQATPLYHAVVMHYNSIVKLLLECGANISEDSRNLGDTMVHLAGSLGHQDLIPLLVKTGADVNAENNTESRLHLAVRKSYDKVVDALCENGADVNARTSQGDTPLHLAVGSGVVSNESVGWSAFNMEPEKSPLLRIINSLMIYNSDLQAFNAEGLPPLFLALKIGNLIVADYLLRSEPRLLYSKDNRGSSLLHAAAKFGFNGFLIHLLKMGAPIHATDDLDRTPLHVAAENGHEQCIRHLVWSGANVEAGDCRNAKPLHLAALNGHTSAVRQLCRDGARIDTNDNSYQTPLFYAARGGQSDVIRRLCLKGANIEARDKHFYTPLYEAIKAGQGDSVRTLCEEGAEVNAINKVGSTVYTPREYALHTKYIWSILDEFGGLKLQEFDLAAKKLSRFWEEEYDALIEKIPCPEDGQN